MSDLGPAFVAPLGAAAAAAAAAAAPPPTPTVVPRATLDNVVALVTGAASISFARKAVVVACVSAIHEAVPLQSGISELRPLVQEVLACHLLEEIDAGWATGLTPNAAAAAGAAGRGQLVNAVYTSADAVELSSANFLVFETILTSTDEQRRAAVAKMGPMLRKRTKSLPNLGGGGSLEIPTEVTAALDRAEADAGRLVSTTLAQRDLKDTTVQAVLAQLDRGARAGDPVKQYEFAVSNSLVVRLLTMVSIKDSIKDAGAAEVRSMTAALHQRLQQRLISYRIHISKCKGLIKAMVSFSSDSKGGVFFVDSIHELLGTRANGVLAKLVGGSFAELQRLFDRAFELLAIMLPDVFTPDAVGKFHTWMWDFDRDCPLPQPQRSAVFRDKVWGRMFYSISELVQLCFKDESRTSSLPQFAPFLDVAGSPIVAGTPPRLAEAYRAVHGLYSRALMGEAQAGLKYPGFKPHGSGKPLYICGGFMEGGGGAAAGPAETQIDYVCTSCHRSESAAGPTSTPPPASTRMSPDLVVCCAALCGPHVCLAWTGLAPWITHPCGGTGLHWLGVCWAQSSLANGRISLHPERTRSKLRLLARAASARTRAEHRSLSLRRWTSLPPWKSSASRASPRAT
jgi:hypothetical protein